MKTYLSNTTYYKKMDYWTTCKTRDYCVTNKPGIEWDR